MLLHNPDENNEWRLPKPIRRAHLFASYSAKSPRRSQVLRNNKSPPSLSTYNSHQAALLREQEGGGKEREGKGSRDIRTCRSPAEKWLLITRWGFGGFQTNWTVVAERGAEGVCESIDPLRRVRRRQPAPWV